MGHPNGPHRGGPDPVKRALRDALGVYVWQHLSRYPRQWFSAVELARVISEQYIGGPRPPGQGIYHYGRSNVIMKILREMQDRGEVQSRPNPARRNATLWKAA